MSLCTYNYIVYIINTYSIYIYYKYVHIAHMFLTDPSLDCFVWETFLTAMQPANSMVKIMGKPWCAVKIFPSTNPMNPSESY